MTNTIQHALAKIIGDAIFGSVDPVDTPNTWGQSLSAAQDVLAAIVVTAAKAQTPAPAPQVTVDGISCLYSEETPQGGVIRIAKWPEGYVLWYHGQIVWRSWAAEGQNDG